MIGISCNLDWLFAPSFNCDKLVDESDVGVARFLTGTVTGINVCPDAVRSLIPAPVASDPGSFWILVLNAEV